MNAPFRNVFEVIAALLFIAEGGLSLYSELRWNDTEEVVNV